MIPERSRPTPAPGDLLESLALRTVFTPIREASAVAETVARIGQACELGLLHRGDRLPPEDQLASALRISTVTLRSALAILRDAGMIETRRGRNGGNFISSGMPRRLREAVPRPTRAELEDLADARSIIDGGAAALAAQRATDAQIARLESLVADMDAATTFERWSGLDSLFHLLLADATGSASLVTLVTDLRARSAAVTPTLDERPLSSMRFSNEQHAAIVRAIRRRAPRAAERAATEHVRSTLALWIGLSVDVHGADPGA